MLVSVTLDSHTEDNRW